MNSAGSTKLVPLPDISTSHRNSVTGSLGGTFSGLLPDTSSSRRQSFNGSASGNLSNRLLDMSRRQSHSGSLCTAFDNQSPVRGFANERIAEFLGSESGSMSLGQESSHLHAQYAPVSNQSDDRLHMLQQGQQQQQQQEWEDTQLQRHHVQQQEQQWQQQQQQWAEQQQAQLINSGSSGMGMDPGQSERMVMGNYPNMHTVAAGLPHGMQLGQLQHLGGGGAGHERTMDTFTHVKSLEVRDQ